MIGLMVEDCDKGVVSLEGVEHCGERTVAQGTVEEEVGYHGERSPEDGVEQTGEEDSKPAWKD